MRTRFSHLVARFVALLCSLASWLVVFFPAKLPAHGLTVTLVVASFERPGVVDVTIDYDLSSLLGSPEAYQKLAASDASTQRTAVLALLPKLTDALQVHIGAVRLKLALQQFDLPKLSAAQFADPAADKFTTFHFTAPLPASRAPLYLRVPYGSGVDYPVGFTFQVPAQKITETSWVEDSVEESEGYNWADFAPRLARADTAPRADEPIAAPVNAPRSWYRELGTYLRLGFHHIVPEGTDHILFVLGLFFLGLTWRKLIAQTTVFTIAHATTLFLSSYGIFRLPGAIVEPLIALSISFIALEDIFRPKLGAGRLAVVFVFGLIHGLGFASSLSDVPFPEHGFVLALLGFNFGVDFGQLFIIGLAFLAVGWFRAKPWFHRRVAIPCCLVIAAIGLFWFVQRVIFYASHA